MWVIESFTGRLRLSDREGEDDDMTITIDPDNEMKSVWDFFVRWITILKGPKPNEAFEALDGLGTGHLRFDLNSFCNDLRNVTGHPECEYSLQDIVLEGEEFEACKED